MIKNLAMGNKADRLRLVLGLILALLAAVLIAVYLGQAKGNDSGGQLSGDATAVVVAGRDIPAGTKITADMVTVKQLPASAVLQGAFPDSKSVVDKVTSVAITTGEQVLPAKITDTGVQLAQFNGDLPLSVVVPQGRRGFAVEISEASAAGGLLRPGTYVDILSSDEVVSAADSSQTVGTSCYVAQDIEVLAVGQSVVTTTAGTVESASEIAAAGAESTAASVTLAVTPQEAASLAAAQRSVDGANVQRQVWLSVRPFGEHGAVGDLSACS